MRLYWFKGSPREERNFGDCIAPVLMRAFTGTTAAWTPPEKAEVFSIGSIASKIPDGFRGTVLGTGTISKDVKKDLSRARVLAIRGAASREACRLPRETLLGDPGILVPILFPDVKLAPTYDQVICPHYIDNAMKKRHPGLAHVDILGSHRAVVAGIARARTLITSSLHALICADALGVPHILEPHPLVRGGLWKFNDYASVFGETITPGVRRLTKRPAMLAKQAELRAAFRKLAP